MRHMPYEIAADRCNIAPHRSALGILSYPLCCPPHMETAMMPAIMAAMRWNETGLYGTVPQWRHRNIRHNGTVQDCLGCSAATSTTAGCRVDSCPTCPRTLNLWGLQCHDLSRLYGFDPNLPPPSYHQVKHRSYLSAVLLLMDFLLRQTPAAFAHSLAT